MSVCVGRSLDVVRNRRRKRPWHAPEWGSSSPAKLLRLTYIIHWSSSPISPGITTDTRQDHSCFQLRVRATPRQLVHKTVIACFCSTVSDP